MTGVSLLKFAVANGPGSEPTQKQLLFWMPCVTSMPLMRMLRTKYSTGTWADTVWLVPPGPVAMTWHARYAPESSAVIVYWESVAPGILSLQRYHWYFSGPTLSLKTGAEQ